MTQEQLVPTEADARSLAEKLVAFSNTLTPAERAIFAGRINKSMPEAEVRGFDWQWQYDPLTGAVFLAWVNDPQQYVYLESPGNYPPHWVAETPGGK